VKSVQEALARQTLLGLPVNAWARRMKRGALSMRGRVGGLDLEVGGLPLRVEGGWVELAADFTGGTEPTLRQLVVRGSMALACRGRSAVRGEELLLREQRIHLDDIEYPRAANGVGSGRLLAGLVAGMGDVELRARAEPDGDVLLHSRDEFVHGRNLQYEPQQYKDTIGYWTISSPYLHTCIEYCIISVLNITSYLCRSCLRSECNILNTHYALTVICINRYLMLTLSWQIH